MPTYLCSLFYAGCTHACKPYNNNSSIEHSEHIALCSGQAEEHAGVGTSSTAGQPLSCAAAVKDLLKPRAPTVCFAHASVKEQMQREVEVGM